jgi:hypothetical protein
VPRSIIIERLEKYMPKKEVRTSRYILCIPIYLDYLCLFITESTSPFLEFFSAQSLSTIIRSAVLTVNQLSRFINFVRIWSVGCHSFCVMYGTWNFFEVLFRFSFITTRK